MTFATEAELCAQAVQIARAQGWEVFAELAEWDLVFVIGAVRLGIEAKLRPSVHALAQVVARMRWGGPEHAAILIPDGSGGRVLHDYRELASALGIALWTLRAPRMIRGVAYLDDGPLLTTYRGPRVPGAKPLEVPDGVTTRLEQAGRPSPRVFTEWRRKALTMAVRLERGPVTLADFKALRLNPKLWIARRWIEPIGKDGRRTLYAAAVPLAPDFPTRGWSRELRAIRKGTA